jgi:non-homologous end joining protein Ku
MARRQSVFSGTLKFGIITIPVKLYKPHFDEEALPSSHLEHNCGTKVLELDGQPETTTGHACGKPVQRPWFCPACESTVEFGTLVKVFDNGVALTQAQVASAKVPEKELSIQEFVRADELDPMNLVEDAYYIEVDGKEALEAYSVLTFALKQSERVAIAYYAQRGTDKMVVIRPYRDGLVLQVLKSANLKDVPSFGTTFGADVVETATFLTKMIEKKTVAFEPSKYKSQHVENLRALLNPPCDAPVPAPKPCKAKMSLAEMLKAMEEAA